MADILAGYRLDTASIATGLLHDVIEDTPVKLPEIQTRFGKRDRRAGRRRHQADPAGAAIRPHQAGGEFPQAGAGDEPRHPRAAGEAGRPAAQHAHAAFRAATPERRRRIARETMEIYAPLAERIGMDAVKTELQTLAFAQLDPEAYATIQARLNFLRGQGADVIEEVRARAASASARRPA